MKATLFLLALGLVLPLAACDDNESTTNPGPRPCAPCVVELDADMDNTVYENAADTSNGAGNVFIAGIDGIGRIKRGLLHFDLSSIPRGAQIDSVEVRMNTVTFNGAVVDVGLHRARSAWGEGTSAATCSPLPCPAPSHGAPATPGDATWVNRIWPDSTWASPGGDYEPSPSAATTVGGATVTYHWRTTTALVGDVQAWVDDPASNHGWFVIGDESSTGTDKWFASREASNATLRPTIVVHYSE